MTRKVKLTERRRKWVGKRSVNLRGTPLRTNKMTEARYSRELQSMVEAMSKDVSREFRQLLKGDAAKDFVSYAEDASLTTAVRIMMNRLNRKWDRIFSEKGKRFAEAMVKQSVSHSTSSLGASLKELSGGLEINVKDLSPRTREIIKGVTEENVDLIKSIQTNFFDQVKTSVMRSITTDDQGGLSGLSGRIDAILKDHFKTHKNKAKNIALDQTRKAYNKVTRSRLETSGVKKFIWKHGGGGQTSREDHVKMDGNVYSFDDLPVIDKRTGERGIPGQAINCHPGDSLIDASNGINKLYRRRYAGELIHLISDNGVVLKATPNHPILTDSGWKAAKLINEGDYVFEALDHCFDGVKADIQNGMPSFVDVFDAFRFYVGSNRAHIGTPGLEFHGDSSDHDVDIIDINGHLPGEFNAFLAKKFCEFILSWAHNNSETLSLADCPSAKLIMRCLGVPPGLVGGLCSGLSLLKGESLGAANARVALASDFDSFLNESLSDDAPGDAVLLGQLKLANARGVFDSDLLCGQFLACAMLWLSPGDNKAFGAEALGEVVRINPEIRGDLLESGHPIKHRLRVVKKLSSEFSSHVYNLENKYNWYIANGIITHNCRCYMVPVIDFNDGEEQ